MTRPDADHQLAAVLLSHVRAAKLMLAYGRLAQADDHLATARNLAWQLPASISNKAKIVAGIAEMQAESDRRHAAVAALMDVPLEAMDLMKDYGDGRLVRRPSR